jgi:hypothetical protein
MRESHDFCVRKSREETQIRITKTKSINNMKTRWQENGQEERVERNRENWLGRGTAQLPVLSFGVSPESARRRGTAQYQVPGGLHDHLKTGVSRTRCKSLLVPLPRATYGVSLHLVLVRRDQTCSAKPPSPGAFACLPCLVSLVSSLCY